MRREQHGIVACCIQGAVRSVAHTRFGERDATLRGKIADHELAIVGAAGRLLRAETGERTHECDSKESKGG